MARPAGSSKKVRDTSDQPAPGRVLEDRSETTRFIKAHAKDIIKLTKEKDTANANLRNAWKLAKEQGLAIKALKTVIKEMRLTEEERMVEEKQLAEYRAALGVVPVVQLVLDLDSAAPIDEDASVAKATDAGTFAYHDGKNLEDNPHAMNTRRGQAWHAAYLHAQNEVIKKMAPEKNGDGQAPAAH